MVLLLALSGCASLHPAPVPVRTSVLFSVDLVDDSALEPWQYGHANCTPDGSFCAIKLRRSTYPYCVAHEIRHAFEGNFHGNAWPTEDCHN